MKKIWRIRGARAAHAKVDDFSAARVLQALERLADERYKPTLVAYDPLGLFNQKVDYRTKRFQRFFYLISVYRTPERDGVATEFDSPVARLEFTGSLHFNLAWQRHNEQWITLYHGQTLEECVESIRSDPFFEP